MQVSSVLGGAGFTIGIVQVLGVNTLKLKKTTVKIFYGHLQVPLTRGYVWNFQK